MYRPKKKNTCLALYGNFSCKPFAWINAEFTHSAPCPYIYKPIFHFLNFQLFSFFF